MTLRQPSDAEEFDSESEPGASTNEQHSMTPKLRVYSDTMTCRDDIWIQLDSMYVVSI